MLTTELHTYLAEFDVYIRQFFDSCPPLPGDFDRMLRYAMGWVEADGTVHAGTTGKRIRPLLLMLCTGAAGKNWRFALPAATAVELLHNFSLIHDDIQDNSDLRHNRPTVWRQWGAPNAINAGDALFTLAFTALSELVSSHIPTEQIITVWKIFNSTSLELTRGQHLDMRFEKQANVTVDEYISMISGKSAALLAACAQIGSLIAGSDTHIAAQYYEFGLNIGIAFQIHDDILGIWGNPSVTGKSTATDILSRKKSLPVLYGLDVSPELRSIYQRPVFADSDVLEVVEILNAHNVEAYVMEQETAYYQKALTALSNTGPHNEQKSAIMQLVESLFKREN